MGRPLRHDTEGAWHHLMNRGADRQDIFSTDDDRHFFEHHLAELVRRELLEIHAYAFMDNHFHLLVRSPRGELSAAMHRLGCEYARWYNMQHHRDGPLFRNRFVSVPIADDAQLLIESRYIHRNPLAFVPIDALPAYRWSSLGAYLGRREAPGWLDRSVLGALLGDADEHRRYVSDPHPSDDQHARWSAFREPVDACDLERAVTLVAGNVPSTARHARAHRSDAELLLATLAVELRVDSAARLAERYCMANAATVRAAARRGRVRIDGDVGFAALHREVLGVLFGRQPSKRHV